jgi:hypothetical protein
MQNHSSYTGEEEGTGGREEWEEERKEGSDGERRGRKKEKARER